MLCHLYHLKTFLQAFDLDVFLVFCALLSSEATTGRHTASAQRVQEELIASFLALAAEMLLSTSRGPTVEREHALINYLLISHTLVEIELGGAARCWACPFA